MVSNMTEITQEQLKELLNYNFETGEFTRLVSTCNRVKVGDISGTIDSKGYFQISVNNKLYLAHRLVFLYMTGAWPADQVDHSNQIKTDNRWCNLRECTYSENQGNRTLQKNNKSGYKGVTWRKAEKKWYASVGFKGKHIYLGRYKEKKDAAMAYNDKATELFGEFACLNEIN